MKEIKAKLASHVSLEGVVGYEAVKKYVNDWNRTGSAVITPKQPPNDLDYIVLCDKENYADFRNTLLEMDFIQGGSKNESWESSEFESYKAVFLTPDFPVNLILTTNVAFYLKFVAATLLAIEMEAETKEERVGIFNAIFEPHVKVKDKAVNSETLEALQAYRDYMEKFTNTTTTVNVGTTTPPPPGAITWTDDKVTLGKYIKGVPF